MNKNLIKFGHGVLIGISNLIPGFSGGTMALILNIYEEFTSDIASFTKTPIKAIKNLWALAIGMLLGIIIATFTIALCLQHFPLITSSFFTGLVIATIPLTVKNIRNRRATTGAIISLFASIVFSLFMPFAHYLNLSVNIADPNFFTIIFVIIIAGIAAATMIIPAASGSLILLAFGLFTPIVILLKDTMVYIKDGNIDGIISACYIIVPFIIGAVLGIILIAKIITYLFKHHDLVVWYAILGLLLTSPFTIYYNAYDTHIKANPSMITDYIAVNIILSIAFFLVGFFGLRWLIKIANKKQENTAIENQGKDVA